MRLAQISHLLTELVIPTIPPLFSESQSLITSLNNKICRGTAVAHIATRYYLAADMARDGEIDLSYVPTAEMLADYFTKRLPKPAFMKQSAAMEMIGIGLRNGVRNCLRNGLGNGFGNGLGNGLGNCLGNGLRNCLGICLGNGLGNCLEIGIGNGLRNALGMLGNGHRNGIGSGIGNSIGNAVGM